MRGYEIEKVGSNFIDVPKPRTIKKLENQVFAFDKVSSIKVKSCIWSSIRRNGC